MKNSKKLLAVILVLAMAAAWLVVPSFGATIVNPEGVTTLVYGFENLADDLALGTEADTACIVTEGNPLAIIGTQYDLTVKNEALGESGKYAYFKPKALAEGNVSLLTSTKFDLVNAGATYLNWADQDELWVWISINSGIFNGYFNVEVEEKDPVTDITESWTVTSGASFKYGTDGSWEEAQAMYGLLTSFTSGEGKWLRLPFANMTKASGEGSNDVFDKTNIQAIKIAMPSNEYMLPTLGDMVIDSISTFKLGAPEPPAPKVTFANTPVNDTFVTGDPAITDSKVIFGYEEFAAGTKLGVKESEPIGILSDNLAGTFYNYEIKDGSGQSGKYADISILDVPTFGYANAQFLLDKYDVPPKNMAAFNELWFWVDTTNCGPQFEGNDISVQFYEDVDAPVLQERWAIGQGDPFYVQKADGSWKAYNANMGMITRLEKNYKGWVRIPFSSMDLVSILGVGNSVFDTDKIGTVVVGFPCDANRIGSSLKLDTIMVAKSTSVPNVTPETISEIPVFGSETLNELPTTSLKKAIDESSETSFTLNVKADGAMLLSEGLFDSLKATGKSITINAMENGKIKYSWTFNGADISDETSDVDLAVGFTSDNSARIKELAGNTDGMVLSFADNGTLPGKAKVKVDVSAQYANGTKINLYYYNKDTDSIEIAASNIIVANGYAEFEITHNSDFYLTTYGVTADNNSSTGGNSSAANNSNSNGNNNGDNNPKTGDSIYLFILLAIATIISVVIVKSRKLTAK